MENVSTNIKAIAIAIIILLFTYWYYARKDGSFVAFEAAIVFGLICLISLVVCTLLVKLFAHYMTIAIYPHLLFRILLPFLVIAFVFWLVYGIVSIPRFSNFTDFIAPVKVFALKHLLYCAICAMVMGIVFSLPLQGQTLSKNALLDGNIKFVVGILGAFVLSICIFYLTKKIKGPTLAPKYANYQSLNEYTGSTNYELKPILDAGMYNLISTPYLLSDKNEIIINFLYSSNDQTPPLLKSLKLNKSGEVIDSLTTDGLLPMNEPVIFEKGYIRGLQSAQLFTWVFDGNKTAQNKDQFSSKTNWKIEEIAKDNANLKLSYFQKTKAFHCETLPEIEWNGTGYYELSKQADTLRFKIDEVYTAKNNGKECTEQTIEYFECKGMDFDLIRLNQREYYKVQPRKK